MWVRFEGGGGRGVGGELGWRELEKGFVFGERVLGFRGLVMVVFLMRGRSSGGGEELR